MAKDDDLVTISRRELAELRSKGMSKEEQRFRSIVGEVVEEKLRDLFTFEDDDGGTERKAGGLLKAVGSMLGIDEDDEDDES